MIMSSRNLWGENPKFKNFPIYFYDTIAQVALRFSILDTDYALLFHY